MKKWFGFLGALLFSCTIAAQTTVVSGVATDSDGTLWTNGTVSVQFVPGSSQSNLNAYRINGAPLSSAVITQGPISLGNSGSFSVTVYDNTQVAPSGSQWQFTVCPNAISKCGSVTTSVTGVSQNITTAVDAAIPAPRFLAVAGGYGYTDVESILSTPVGGTYWNVTDLCQRYYNGLTWSCGSGGTWNSITGGTQTGSGTSQVNTFPGAIEALELGPFYVADQYAGADCGAKINAAITASGGTGTILVGSQCGYTISTLVNPTAQAVSIWFATQGVWYMSAPIILGTSPGVAGASLFGLPASEALTAVSLKAVPNYSGMCPADSAGTAFSALICMGTATTIRDIAIDGNGSNQPSATLTSYAASGGVCTLQGTNTFTAGQPVYFNITVGPTFLNPELPYYSVLSTGLSGSQFKVNCPGQTGSGSATGTAAAAIQDVLLQNHGQGTISYASLVYASEDGLHATSTFYPTVTASEALSLGTIVYLYSSTGLPQLFQVTVAGTGTSSYPGYPAPGCTPVLNSTCTWGGVTFKNIGNTYDNTTSNMFIGPNVTFYQNGRDGIFKERDQDWLVAEKVQFEGSGRDGTHEEDAIVARFVGDDWGANGRWGHYVAAVHSNCNTQNGAGGDFISGAQLAGNAAGDIYVNGSAASAIGFCATPSTYQSAGSMVIDGNQFDGPGSSANLVNAIQFVDAGANDLTGNTFGGGHFGNLYNYLVTSQFSLLTGDARLPSTISNVTVSPNYAGQSYQSASPFSLIAGVDVADASFTQGTKTIWGNVVINGSLKVTDSGVPVSPEPENYVLQSATLNSSPTWGVGHQGSGIDPVVTACPSCADPYGNTGTGVYTVAFNLGGGGVTSFSSLLQGLTPPSGAISGIRKVWLKASSGTSSVILAGQPSGCATTTAVSTSWTPISVYCSTIGSDEFVIETEGVISPDTVTVEAWNPCATYSNGQCASPIGEPVATTSSPVDYTKDLSGLGLIIGDPFAPNPPMATGFRGTDSNLLTAGTVSGTGASLCTDANGGATTVGCSGGGGGGDGAGKTVSLLADSRFIVSSSCQPSVADHDAFSTSVVTGTGPYTFIATLPGTNTHATGDVLTLAGITAIGFTALNGQNVTLLATPTSVSYSAIVTGVTAGTSGAGTDACTYTVPQQLQRQPSNTASTIITLAVPGLMAADVAASPATYIPTVTGANQIIVNEVGSQDCLYPGCIPATVESNLQTIWAYERAHGYTEIVASTLIPTQGSVFAPDSRKNEAQINAWMAAQARSAANVASGGYFDALNDLSSILPDPYNANLMQPPSAPSYDHLTDGGAAKIAANTADAVATLTGIIPPVPSQDGNSFFSIFDSVNGGALSLVQKYWTPDTFGPNIFSCAYFYGSNGWNGVYDESYGTGPAFCLTNPISGEALFQLHQNAGLAWGAEYLGVFGYPPDLVIQRAPSAAHTAVIAASAADAKAGTGSGNLVVNNITMTGALLLTATRKGTIVCTSGGTITVANTNYISTSDVIITMNTLGGTPIAAPFFSSVTSETGFNVTCSVGDTSTYNYDILN